MEKNPGTYYVGTSPGNAASYNYAGNSLWTYAPEAAYGKNPGTGAYGCDAALNPCPGPPCVARNEDGSTGAARNPISNDAENE